MKKLVYNEDVKQLVFKYFSGDIIDIVFNIIDRFIDSYNDKDEYFDWGDDLIDAVNDELIYYDDQWEVLKYYTTPQEVNYNEVMDEFLSDLVSLCDDIIDLFDEDDDSESEEN